MFIASHLPAALPLHGVGGRQDLPVPFSTVLVGALVVLAGTFAILVFAWRSARFDPEPAGRPVGEALTRLIDGPAVRWTLRALGLAASAWVAVAAWLGPDDALNPTATAVYVLFWVGVLAFGSALVGPLWQLMNPLRTIHEAGCALLRRDHTRGLSRLPARLGVWPAVFTLGAFLWLELAAPDRTSTHTLRNFAVVYALAQLSGAALFGSRWFAAADGFEVYSRMFGRLSILSRRKDRVLVWRNPLASIAATRPEPGMAAVLSVMLGATAFDGLSGSPMWVAFSRDSSLGLVTTSTMGLLLCVFTVALVYTSACALSSLLARGAHTAAPRTGAVALGFASSLIPIAFGYVVAHYYSLLVLYGQEGVVRLSDPLGRGSDLLGTANLGVSDAWVQPTFVAVLSVCAVTVGHVVGAVSAHDRALSLFPSRSGRAQLPIMVAMLGYTFAGLSLLFAA